MKIRFPLIICFLLFHSTLAGAGENRRLGAEDLEWGHSGTVLSPEGVVSSKINAGHVPVAYGSSPGFSVDNALSAVLDVRAFGAVIGTGKSVATKNANAAAIMAAWNDIIAAGGGTVLIPGVIEVGANVLNFGDNTSHWYNLSIVGLGYTKSKIISESTTNVIDCVGRNYLSIQNIGIISSTARIGLLMARNSGSPNCNGNSLSGVWINGSYSVASFVSIAAETLRVDRSKFWNNNAHGKTYWSSPYNQPIGATTVNGKIVASSNTDIHFYMSEFYNVQNNSHVVRLDDGFVGDFMGCNFTAGEATGSKLITFAAYNTNIFRGPVKFSGNLFEGGTDRQVYFLDNGVPSGFYQLTFDTNYFNNYKKGCKVFGYHDTAKDWLHEVRFVNNRINPLISDLELGFTVNSYIEQYSEEGTIHILNGTAIVNSDLKAASVTWNGTAYGVGARISIGDRGGATPSRDIYGPQPYSNSGDTGGYSRGRILQIAPQRSPYDRANSVPGAVVMVDSGYWIPFGIPAKGGKPYPAYYDGTGWKQVGPLPATPTSAKATCTAGTFTYDSSYVYVCISDNTWKRSALSTW